jgi:hypothetical protein
MWKTLCNKERGKNHVRQPGKKLLYPVRFGLSLPGEVPRSTRQELASL